MKRITAFAVLLVVLAAPAWAGWDEGVAAYERGDYATALREMRVLAAQGHDQAQYNLGVLYDKGQGVARNIVLAHMWSTLFEDGRTAYEAGDYAVALRRWRPPANHGHAGAQFNLGVMYEKGQGVAQDDVKAARWYRRAAEQGVAEAQSALGDAYHIGRGVMQNYIHAHMWFDLAAARGDETAAENRDIVARRMTPAQIAEAQRRARAWRTKAQRRKQRVAATVTRRDTGTDSVPARPVKKTSTGSGFYVSDQGHILTSAHVVSGCREVRIPASLPVSIVAQDEASDLALLKSSGGKANSAAKFRGGGGIRPGDDIVVVGYRGLFASEANVTAGTVSAPAGRADDRRFFQITAPVQPGNSGGPVLDMAGNAVGVVMAKPNALRIARATGDIPQNVNFAISAGTARAFLDTQNVPYETAPSAESLKQVDVASQARKFTVLVACRK